MKRPETIAAEKIYHIYVHNGQEIVKGFVEASKGLVDTTEAIEHIIRDVFASCGRSDEAITELLLNAGNIRKKEHDYYRKGQGGKTVPFKRHLPNEAQEVISDLMGSVLKKHHYSLHLEGRVKELEEQLSHLDEDYEAATHKAEPEPSYVPEDVARACRSQAIQNLIEMAEVVKDNEYVYPGIRQKLRLPIDVRDVMADLMSLLSNTSAELDEMKEASKAEELVDTVTSAVTDLVRLGGRTGRIRKVAQEIYDIFIFVDEDEGSDSSAMVGAIAQIIASANLSPEPEEKEPACWIRMSERVPSKDGLYITFSETTSIRLLYRYWREGGWEAIETQDPEITASMTHWAPVPDSPTPPRSDSTILSGLLEFLRIEEERKEVSGSGKFLWKILGDYLDETKDRIIL